MFIACDVPPTLVSWSTNPATPFTSNGQSMTLTSAPAALRTTVSARVTDSTDRSTLVACGIFLTAQNHHFFDHNSDGCNDLNDLWEFAADYWSQPHSSDPDGSSFVDILDFLYINLDDVGGSCP